ncbi:MAG: adenosylcobinamide-GDP ribazoletransferase [Candidatus Nanopelagicales bacterium]|nr:adenosylcobinamide-GDP ribazoletransferase [Candidatus Nanopelagicales bacterium]
MTGLPDPARFALGTFTRLPVPAPSRVDADIAGRGLALAPLVGAGLGLVSGLPLLVTGVDLVARLLGATLVVLLAAWLTRGLHWDGLADVADGLGSSGDPARARAVMARSDIGPFGVLTLVGTLAVQVLALAQVPAEGPVLAAWVLALTLGRLAAALACGWWVRPARSEGLGAVVVGTVTPARLVLAVAGTALVAVGATWGGPLPALEGLLLMPLAAAAVAVLLTRVAARRFGGTTGDVIGATTELAAAAALLVLALG